jgi:hypothetical protein
MKNFFLKFPTYIATILMGAGMLFSCSQYDEPEYKRQSFSGEEYFKGIYFFEGEVADKIQIFSTLKQKYVLDHDVAVKEGIQKLSNEVMDIIRKEDAGFFSRFDGDIESKDHMRVEKALNDGGQRIKESIVKLFQNNKEYHEAMKLSENIDIEKAIGSDGLVDKKKLAKLYEEFLVKTTNNLESDQVFVITHHTNIDLNIDFNVNIHIITNIMRDINIHIWRNINVHIWRNINVWNNQGEIMPQREGQDFTSSGLHNEMVIQQIVETF